MTPPPALRGNPLNGRPRGPSAAWGHAPYGCNTDEQSSQNPDNAIAKKALLSLSDSSAFCVYWNFFGSFFVKKEQISRTYASGR